MTGLA
jgi:hypothetical protein